MRPLTTMPVGTLIQMSFKNTHLASEGCTTRGLPQNTISVFGDLLSYISGKGDKRKNKLGQHQTKNFCPAKETINKMKRQPTEWKNIFVNISDK